MAVGDLAVAGDHISLGHAIDAEIDCRAPRGVGADAGVRIAVAAEEAPGRARVVLIVDAVKPDPLLLGEGNEQRMLGLAFDAPGGKDIDDVGLALGEICACQARHVLSVCAAQLCERGEGEFRHRLAEQRRGEQRRIAAPERVPEEPGERREDHKRKGRRQTPQGRLSRHVGHGVRFRGGFPGALAFGFAGAEAERRLIPLRSRSARMRRCLRSSSTTARASAAMATKVTP